MLPCPQKMYKIHGLLDCLMNLQQNGVGDNSTHDGAFGNFLVELEKRRGNGVDELKRPNTLQLAPASAAFIPKKCVEFDDEEDMNEGSLPCSPELESHDDTDNCSAGDSALDSETVQLISGFFSDFIANKGPRFSDSKALVTMKRVVDGLLEKHRYAYNGMINKLSQDMRREDDIRFVRAVAKSVFKDGHTNWGRIASLVAFGAVMCQYMKQMGRDNNVELVGQEISAYLLSEQRDWLVKNNSWDGFVDFFRVSDPETAVRNALLGLAGVAGIGALALLIK